MTSILSTEGLESAILSILNCKQDVKKASSGQELQKHARDGLGAILHLHMQYIEQCKASNSASKLVAEQKTSYQKSLLALQNKRVEKLFYERMINANRNFCSKIGDEDVDLVPEEDAATVSPEVAHENMKRRLQDEYTQREALQKDRVALEERLHELQNEVKAKRHKLDSAKGVIEQVSAAAKPAFRHLRLGALDWADTANTAMFPQLPPKLQALYFQIATATGFSSVDAQVTIEQARKRKQVVLSMVVKGAKLTVIFGLLQDIDIITARCSDKDKSQYVLEALYPDDPGDSWPSGKQPTQDMHSMARPYRWCQDIVKAPDVASGEQSSLQRTVELLHLLQQRCVDLTSLWSHLQALKSGKAPTSGLDDDAVHGPEAGINRWKELQGITVAPLQQVRKDGPKEEGELEECDKDTGPPQTNLDIRHEGVLEVEGIPAFAVALKVSLYYPYVFPDFRITPLEGINVPCEQLASIEAEANALLPLEAPHDPLPAQFSYLCRMLHAILAGQGAPHAALPTSSNLRGNLMRRGRLGMSRPDPVQQIDHAIHV